MPAPKAGPAAGMTAAGASLLLAALGLGLLALAAVPVESGATPWIGYRSVLVEASVPEAELLASLSAAGVRDLLSESTEPVLISGWAGLETRTLADARSILVAGDPRLDDYLKRLSLWFRARVRGVDYRAYYVAASPSFDAGARLIRGLAPFKGRYEVPASSAGGSPGGGNGLSFAGALLLILAGCAAGPLIGKSSSSIRGLVSRRQGKLAADRMAFRLSIALPWAALAGGGLPAAAIAALWALAAVEAADRLDLPLDEFRRNPRWKNLLRSLMPQGLPPLALLAVAILSLAAAPRLLPSAGLAIIGSLAGLAGYALLTARIPTSRRFLPVPIGGLGSRSPRGPGGAGKARAGIACAALIAWGLCRLLSPSSGTQGADIAFPSPVPARGSARPLLAEALQRSASEAGDILPGLASYLEHRAYQEALPYIRVGEGRPDPFAPARLPMPPGSAAAETAAGVAFDDDWARSAYRSVPALSIEGMLLSQGKAVAGKFRPGVGRSLRPLAPIGVLLYILLLVPLFGRILAGLPLRRETASGELRQEA
jgi:hypothetical protein